MRSKEYLKDMVKGKWMVAAFALVCTLGIGSLSFSELPIFQTAVAEQSTESVQAPSMDASPAIYVNEKNAHSVVGIITNIQAWDRSIGVQNTMVSQGSGVVIAEGGYVLTNNHVVEDGSFWQVLLPSGEKVEATLVGTDSAMDLAVLKVDEQADTLVPVSIGSSADLRVGSTVIAIGNPGGEVLANTVTSGIISALGRTSMSTNNTTRNINYIQHDAPINSGNSGGGLFDYQGNLIGINTLKYSGSVYIGATFEGLGFAIPVETAYPIAQQLIEHGKVIRPQMGVTVADYEGPDEPMNDYPPASVCVYDVNEESPAQKSGIRQYDFITAINGERVTSLRQLTTVLDRFKPGDTVTVTVVRYKNVGMVNNNPTGYYYNPFNFGFGGFNYGHDNGQDQYQDDFNNGNTGSVFTVGGGYSTLEIDITLEVKED